LTEALLKSKFWAVGVACFLLLCAAPASALAGSISGTVTADGGGPIDGSVGVCANPEVGFGACVTVNEEDPEYTIEGLEGEYRVSFSAVGNNYVPQYWQGSSNYTDATVLDVREADELTGINADMVSGSEIKGTLVGTDGNPIYRADACAREVGGNQHVSCALTNEAGEYAITSLAPDTYKLYFEEGFQGPEYVVNYWPEKATYAEAEVLNIGGKESLTANATLALAGRIEGALTGEGQSPGSGEVCAYELDETKVECGYAFGAPEYAIRRLAAESYVLKFTLGGYQTEYSGGASDFADATPVTVTGGQATTANADLTGEPAIRGTVTDALDSEPIESVLVCAEASNGTVGCALSEEDGHYAVPVSAGSYEVSFNDGKYVTQYYDGVADAADATRVTVTDAPVGGIDAELELAGTIAGQVATTDGGANLESVEVCAVAAGGAQRCRNPESSGAYEIPSLAPGSYKVRFSLNGYFTQFFDDKATEAAAESVTVTAGHESGGVDATLVAEEAPTNSTPPLLSGVGKVGATLSCSNGVWSGNPPSFTYEYFWFRAEGQREEEIEGAESNTYTLGIADAGASIYCAVVATNSAGTEGEYSSNEIAVAAIHTVTVTRSGDGIGTVTSVPAGIECGPSCRVSLSDGDSLTLTATPATGSEFTGWSGACTGVGPCVITVGANTSVVAGFAKKASERGGGDTGGGSGTPSTPGGTSGSNPPASPAPSAPKPAPKHTKKKPLQCKKGFHKAKHKGKVRCVKVKSKGKGKRG
jgi:5-hydroxyisourate hydrolase-like protein (transthyretin family)